MSARAVAAATRRDLWALHPRGAELLALGGTEIDPPAHCNLVLTNKCNLRCEICGSQKYLDLTRTARSHMPIEVFRAVAQTLFPVLASVELNSQGDPLLYPQIVEVLETLAAHRCEMEIQTNGTLFSDAVLDALLPQHGMVSLSLDAVGPVFDFVRRRGNWERAEPGMRALFRRRDPSRLMIRVRPTVTRRTVGEILSVARWAAEHDLDRVDFHSFVPTQASTEEVPTADEMAAATDALADWIAVAAPAAMILVDGRVLNRGRGGQGRRTRFACPVKSRFRNEFPLHPVEADDRWASGTHVCMAPVRGLDVSMEGTVQPCCHAQSVPFGMVTSVEAFARTWFGRDFRRLRGSLQRDGTGLVPMPACRDCVRAYAPRAVPDAWAHAAGGEAAPFAEDTIVPTLVGRHMPTGHCFMGRVPPGLRPGDYELLEDGSPLPHPGADLADIVALGGGRYRIEAGRIYFSSSDPLPPLRNGRRYVLRRVSG